MSLRFGSNKVVPILKYGEPPTASTTITENGTYNVAEYASAKIDVNPPSGYDFPEAEFRAKCAELETYIPTGNSLTTKDQHAQFLTDMQSNGWLLKAGKYNNYIDPSSSEYYKGLQYVFVLTFSYSTKYVWFTSSNSACKNLPVAFKLPSSAELVIDGYDNETASSRVFAFCVKFNGDERTIMYGTNSPSGSQSVSYIVDTIDLVENTSTLGSGNTSTQYGYPPAAHQLRALKYYDVNAWTSSSNPDYYGLMTNVMCDAKIIESGRYVSHLACGKQTSIPNTQYILERLGNVEDLSFLTDFYSSDFYDSNLGVIKTLSSSTFWNATNLRKYLLYGAPSRFVFPVIVDLSGDTGTGTWQPFNNYSYAGYTNSIYNKLHTVYIKLPSTYTTVDLTGYSTSTQSGSNNSPCFTLESWQYMANNAPNVSSKTLKVGQHVYNLMKASYALPEYAAAAATLEGKGWTLSA